MQPGQGCCHSAESGPLYQLLLQPQHDIITKASVDIECRLSTNPHHHAGLICDRTLDVSIIAPAKTYEVGSVESAEPGPEF